MYTHMHVLQCVAVCYRVLQCIAMCHSVLCVAVRYSALQCITVCCSMLQCVATRHTVLQCATVRCSVTQCDTVWCRALLGRTGWRRLIGSPRLQIIFHKRATKYRSLLQKMTCKDKGFYESSPPCTQKMSTVMFSTHILTHNLHSGYGCIHMWWLRLGSSVK